MFFRVVNFLILKSYHKKLFFWKKDNDMPNFMIIVIKYKKDDGAGMNDVFS